MLAAMQCTSRGWEVHGGNPAQLWNLLRHEGFAFKEFRV